LHTAIGSRVKYLVDTPEVIWGCLDSRRYLEAARRLLRAHQVHDMMLTSFPKEALSKFPLLTHQWPIVEKFRCEAAFARRTLSSRRQTVRESSPEYLHGEDDEANEAVT
jgi:hypothetical protein